MTEKTVKASDLDPNFKFEVAKTFEGKTVLWCVQCGMCTSNCPYSDILDVKPHQVVKMVLLGMKRQALDCRSIWLCSTCFMCAERCPQGVEVARVMFALKNMAAKEKGVPEGYKLFGQQVMQNGRAMKITSLREKEREHLGLPKMPRTDSEAIKDMLKKVKLDEILNKEGDEQQ